MKIKAFDIWGYKTGLDHYGWDRLSEFDEVVVANNTVFGPVFPFSQMFAGMANRDLDFWGLTRHYEHEKDPTDSSPLGYTTEHVQSYFMGFRKSFIQSADFRGYWDNLPALNSYHEAIGKHETYFTHYFSEPGLQVGYICRFIEPQGPQSQPDPLLPPADDQRPSLPGHQAPVIFSGL